MKYNVYFASKNIKFMFLLHRRENITNLDYLSFSIDLLQCTSEIPTSITFLFVNQNIKCGYALS